MEKPTRVAKFYIIPFFPSWFPTLDHASGQTNTDGHHVTYGSQGMANLGAARAITPTQPIIMAAVLGKAPTSKYNANPGGMATVPFF